jgi:hypothetical protein
MTRQIGDDFYAADDDGRPLRIPWDAELGMYEPSPEDPLWWMSFCAADPPGEFLGVVVVQAPTAPAAVIRSHVLGVNPGGEIQMEGPIPADVVPVRMRDRLLSREEAENAPDGP